jgi:hypothetical protein
MLRYTDLNPFTQAYIDAIFFTDASGDNPEFEGLGFYDFSIETLNKIVTDCASFEMLHSKLLEQAGTPEQNGHDFWLTRNGYCAGFLERGYPEKIGESITAAAEKYCEVNLVKGDNGLLYLE